MKHEWPKGPYRWVENNIEYISIPFTWNLPHIKKQLQGFQFYDKTIIGGPAVQLMPNFFNSIDNVIIQKDYPGILQKINPHATRTTLGCIRKCKFCAIGSGVVEAGGFRELPDWPDLPILCDNNLLACSDKHFNKVIDRLVKWTWADFNQGLDCRLLTKYHALKLAEIKNPIIRLSCDTTGECAAWEKAFTLLREAKISKAKIRSYCLIGFNDTPKQAWERCLWVEAFKILVCPMWFHNLSQLTANSVTENQRKHGWGLAEMRHIMGYFYRRRGQAGPLNK